MRRPKRSVECSDSEKNMSAFADQNHAPSLTSVRLESSVHFCDFKIYEVNELMKQKNGFSGQLGFVYFEGDTAAFSIGWFFEDINIYG